MLIQPLDFWPLPRLNGFDWRLVNCSVKVEDVKDVPRRLAYSATRSKQQKIAEYR
jgi:hypothetical protein